MGVLREVWHSQSVLISECLCFAFTQFIQKIPLEESTVTLIDGLVGVLTPQEVKYLAIKLDNVLSLNKKEQLAELIWKNQLKISKRGASVIGFYLLSQLRSA